MEVNVSLVNKVVVLTHSFVWVDGWVQFQLAIAVAIELSLALLSLLNSPPTHPPGESIKEAHFSTTKLS